MYIWIFLFSIIHVIISNQQKVQDTLKEHASQVRLPPVVAPASVTSHPTPNNTSQAWKKIYANPDLYME